VFIYISDFSKIILNFLGVGGANFPGGIDGGFF